MTRWSRAGQGASACVSASALLPHPYDFFVKLRPPIANAVDLVQLGHADDLFLAGKRDVDLRVQNLLAVAGFGESAAAGVADF